MADSPKAVFLSYAREDADAARRIGDALRSQGVEVWFDQSELRGGDSWDAKIRKQINDCALFLPIISQSTQERGKGYFRFEWKLAVEQTHLMAEGIAFLAPVVVDDTPENGALIPPEFLRVQWTRLPGALSTPQFVAHVKRLLESPGKATAEAGRLHPAHREKGGASSRKVGRRVPAAAWLLALAVTVIALAMIWWRKPGTEPDAGAGTRPPTTEKPATPGVADLSIAVLPFANMSDDKENGFFADGVHEDLLGNLANIGALRVISRTSVMGYRDTKKPMRQIGSELGVAYILEGSVRRTGNKVRVAGQLIDARTEGHVWSASYDKDLSDVFAIQTALATEITTALRAVLSPQEKARLARAPTVNASAYDLYLKARDLLNREGRNIETLPRAEALLQSALEYDPKFAAAWGDLAGVIGQFSNYSYDPTGARLAKRRQAVETMERLAPNDPETWVALSQFLIHEKNYARGESYLQRAAEALPNNAYVILQVSEMDRRHGRWTEALGHLRQAYSLDRQNPDSRDALEEGLIGGRRYEEAAAFAREDSSSDGFFLALVPFFARGSTKEMEAWIAAHPQANREYFVGWGLLTGASADFVRQLDETRRGSPSGFFHPVQEANYAAALMDMGETARAREAAAINIAHLKAAGPTGSLSLATNLALLGEKPAAFEAIAESDKPERAAGLNPDFLLGVDRRPAILALLGEKEQALAELTRLLKVPCGLNVHRIRRSWMYKSLRGDPRFEALLNDPKNNEPLF